MSYLFYFGEILLVAALVGLIAVVIWLVLTVLHLKTAVMGDAKRLSERPIRVVKNLIATGKGIAQQETARVKRIAATVKGPIKAVKDTAGDIKLVASSIDVSELPNPQPAMSRAQTILKFAANAFKLARSAAGR